MESAGRRSRALCDEYRRDIERAARRIEIQTQIADMFDSEVENLGGAVRELWDDVVKARGEREARRRYPTVAAVVRRLA